MKNRWMVSLTLLLTGPAFSSGYCWQIHNPDTKALCESKFEHKSNCWLIKNPDLKAYCDATAYGKNSCWIIKDHDLRMMCKAESSSR